ncbi:MAG: ATP synthase F1 subunit epsilon [Fusobacterium gastrosuis]|uniref:ATP synthase F1 subunit epsilon n=1 Tax=Fusobacterium gastrosuis TaxID=1755100 RepID=UPI001F4F4D1F|nr:ATP synthase F1 subunit epsilon [Fusobacterium gastrosuis]MDY5795707.1 ATP synthase F1 subunit epsilon [Fusobacterium gastrosuis]
MATFKVKVVTHTKKVVEHEADYVKVRTTEGELGILANHAPLVAELEMGIMEIDYDQKAKKDVYFLTGGFLEISNNEAVIIADDINNVNEIDVEEEDNEIRRLNQLLSEEVENVKILERKIQESTMKIEMRKMFNK